MIFSVVATCDIAAPAECVWEALTDVARWSDWSHWLAWDSGTPALGERLQLRLTPPDGGGYAFAPEVIVLDAPRHFAWIGRTGAPGVFDGEHHFVLTPIDQGTRLENRERYSGILSPLMRHLPMMKGAKAGFDAMNEELRARAEALYRRDRAG
jgi:hypothetical protein